MMPALFGITILVFLLVRVSGDPVQLMLPDEATQQQIDQLRESLGLNKPLPAQYVTFVGNLLKGNLGTSLRYSGRPALEIVMERLPATALLGAAALIVSIAISLPAGILAALRRGTWVDHLVSVLAVLGQAMPNFWLGLMLMLLFAVHLKAFPVSGYGTLNHLVLPAVTLGTGMAAILMRLLRTSVLEVLNLDYIRTARAKGLGTPRIAIMHVLRNAVLAYITVVGLQVPRIVAGAVVTEQVFAWPGMGLLTVQAVNFRDMAVIQGIVIVSSLIVMLANLVVDIAYSLIDPRISYA